MTKVDSTDLVFLVVDDDGQVREILTEYLTSFGYKNILQAKDGKGGLKIIQNHAQRIDFVISDWEMPHIDGLTLLRAVRKDPLREHVKFLMVSSQSSRERIKISEAAKARVDAYVVKPFRSQLLKEKITNLILYGEDKSAKEFESSFGDQDAGTEASGASTDRIVPSQSSSNEAAIGASIEASVQAHQGASMQPPMEIVEVGPPPESYDLSKMNLSLVTKLAGSYMRMEWFDKAIRLCTEASMVFPDNADIIFILANAYSKKEDFQEAMLLLKKVVKISPYHVEARTLMAEIEDRVKVA